MNNDLDIIIKKYPRDQKILRVYAIGDIHVGSAEYNEAAIKKKLKIIEEDPYAALCICGDLGDYGLKNSKTNVYQATMTPREQQKYIHKLFLPVVDKITAAVPGNHEERITKEVGTCPLYDLCVLWGIPEVYRENLAITKYFIGNKSARQQYMFVGITTHGATRARHKKFIAGFDGVDFAVSGHTHTPEYSPHGKIRVDRHKTFATHVSYKEIVVDANLSPGGYSIKKEYEIAPPPELQYLELYIRSNDNSNVRTMDYHSISI